MTHSVLVQHLDTSMIGISVGSFHFGLGRNTAKSPRFGVLRGDFITFSESQILTDRKQNSPSTTDSAANSDKPIFEEI